MKPRRLFPKKHPRQTASVPTLDTCWTLTIDQLFTALYTTPNGLQQTDAVSRIKQYGTNAFKEQRKNTARELALGLAPELLPAIISITLAHDAQQRAKRGVHGFAATFPSPLSPWIVSLIRSRK